MLNSMAEVPDVVKQKSSMRAIGNGYANRTQPASSA